MSVQKLPLAAQSDSETSWIDKAANWIPALRGNAALRSRIGSVCHLLTGNFAVAGIMLASMALAARGLGPKAFGAFALILAVGRVSERLLRFESWQPLVRYVAQEEETRDRSRLARLYAYGLLLDVSSAFLAALLAVASGFLAGQLVGLEPGQQGLIAIYACAIALNIRGMPSAALRMAGRFRTLAYVQFVSGMVRLVLAFVLVSYGAGLLAFVMLWTAAQILDSLLFNWLGLRALSASEVPSPFRASWRGLPQEFPGFLRFAFSTNFSSMLRTLTHEADTLLVGFFAGPAAAGLYHLSRRLAKVAQQAGDLIQTVAYPDLARMWAGKGRGFFAHTVRGLQVVLALLAAAALGLVWLFGEQALRIVFGPGFVGAYPLLLAQMVAMALLLHSAPSRTALLAMNRPTYVLAVAAASTVIFFAVAGALLPALGALGANLAHIAFGLTTGIALDLAIWRSLARGPAVQGSANVEGTAP